MKGGHSDICAPAEEPRCMLTLEPDEWILAELSIKMITSQHSNLIHT